MKCLIDTSAWVEYLEGSLKGEKVSQIVQDKNNHLYTLSLIIAETISKIKRKKENAESAFNIISKNTELINIDADMSKEAGLLHSQEKEKNDSFSLADALIATTAKYTNSKILTGDNHFKQFKEAIII